MTSKNPENIAFIGREGSGKSTQAHELAKYLNKPYISTGDILRDLAKNDTGVWGKACRDMFEKSVYLDGQMLIEILVHRLSQDDCQEGFILDGGLRTLKETIIFKDMLVSASRDYPNFKTNSSKELILLSTPMVGKSSTSTAYQPKMKSLPKY